MCYSRKLRKLGDVMLAVHDKNKFKIDEGLLEEAINSLLTKKRSYDEEKELLYLSLFLKMLIIQNLLIL